MISNNAPESMPQRVDIGDDEPLYIRNVEKGPPDRRRVSVRWLAGSVLTGIFSTILVGGALQAAIGVDDGRIVKPTVTGQIASNGGAEEIKGAKGDRMQLLPPSETVQRVIKVSTVTRMDDRDLVKVRPFAHIRSNMAKSVDEELTASIPDFNPLAIFSDGAEQIEIATTDSIYSAEVDGEVTIKISEFPLEGGRFNLSADLSMDEIKATIATSAPFMADGAIEVASLPYLDSRRFEFDNTAVSALAVAIVPENVSFVEKTGDSEPTAPVEDASVIVASGESMTDILTEHGATLEEANAIQLALVENFTFEFRAGQTLRIAQASVDDEDREGPVRVTLYDTDSHLATVALSDGGTFVPASEPTVELEPLDFEEEDEPAIASNRLPNAYKAIWQTALSMDMPKELVGDLIQIFAFDVDFQSRILPNDELEVVYAADNNEEGKGDILYASITISGVKRQFYRYNTKDDGQIDYYDETGKSAKKFLLRKPMANGRYRSAFGMRRHPILGRYKMHTGVDWSAPRGTAIMAAGNGVISYAGWKGGYGKHIKIRHANGYVSTYSHMRAYSKGMKEGLRVRQGQVIGYVGSTGLSTGPHLHYEVLVNKRFVDPMKIRLPRGRILQGNVLETFDAEKTRIDELINKNDAPRYAQLEN